MNSFLVLVCLIFCTTTQCIMLPDELQVEVDTKFNECVKQELLSTEEVTRVREWNFNNPSDSMKCMCACFLEKFDVLKDNKVQVEHVSRLLTPVINEERTNELLRLCKDTKGAERCETGFKILQCVWDYKAF